jgi:hypothetical protein
MLVNIDPAKRPCIETIKETEWYKGRIYTQEELVFEMDRLFKKGRQVKLKRKWEKLESFDEF